jgi:hypothetical protein
LESPQRNKLRFFQGSWSKENAMHASPSVVRLSRWERRGLVAFLVLLLGFGVLVEVRSAFLSRRMGDLGVYLRAAWAVRTGNDIYTVTDNQWHYSYPPLLAILLVPLADAPPGADAGGLMPFAVSAGLCYALSLVFLFLGAHWLAAALEATSTDPAVRAQPRFCRRWWILRLWPVLACLPPIGHTLMRGQVNLLVLAMLCAAVAAVIRGRRFRAGLWLAGPMCIKIFPAFLLLYPLWRRDGRCLAGCALGLTVGLALVPVAVFGPARTWDYYQELTDVLIRPALGSGTDQSRAKELIEVTATDSQSIQATLHNTLHLDPATRPTQVARGVRLVSLAAGGGLTLLVLLAAGWRRPQDGCREVIFFGALILNMLLLSPVCHLHYFCLAVPLIGGLIAARWEQTGVPLLGLALSLLLGTFVVANTLPHFPVFQVLRDAGLAMYGSLALWCAGVVVLWRRGKLRQVATTFPDHRLSSAA